MTIKSVFKRAPGVLSAVASDPVIAGKMAGALARGRFRDAMNIARTTVQRPDLRMPKIVSRRYRYLWICVPKAASRSLMTALLDADPDAERVRHMTLSEIFAMRPEVKDYYSFAFVRHPFDRALSLYREIFFSPKSEASNSPGARNARCSAHARVIDAQEPSGNTELPTTAVSSPARSLCTGSTGVNAPGAGNATCQSLPQLLDCLNSMVRARVREVV